MESLKVRNSAGPSYNNKVYSDTWNTNQQIIAIKINKDAISPAGVHLQ